MTKKYELCALGKSRDLKKSHYKSDIGTKKRLKKLLLSLRTILNLIYMKAIPFLLQEKKIGSQFQEDNIATVVNVFSVQPQNQQKFIEIQKAFAGEIAQKQAGFISANLHKSFDKTRVANYAQWRRKEDVEAMLKVPDAKDYFDQMSEVSSQNWSI